MRPIDAEPIERALFKLADKSLAKNPYENARICAFRQAFELILKAPTITPPPSDPLDMDKLRKKVPNLGAPVPELDLWNLGIIAVQENALKNYGKTWIVCRLEPEK